MNRKAMQIANYGVWTGTFGIWGVVLLRVPGALAVCGAIALFALSALCGVMFALELVIAYYVRKVSREVGLFHE